jgi:hypothetical protein
MLLLWVAACAGVYFFVPEFPPHALSGVTLPLSVLAVRGWGRAASAVRAQRRLRVPPLALTVLAVGSILVFTVPGAIYHGQSSADVLGNTTVDAAQRQLELLSDDQAAALAYIDHSPRPGAVLAPWFLSLSVPEFTGRQAYAGHQMWQPPSNVTATDVFFSPNLNSAAIRRRILLQSRATFVLADCVAPRRLAADLAPVAHVAKRFGCVTVYELSRSPGTPARRSAAIRGNGGARRAANPAGAAS